METPMMYGHADSAGRAGISLTFRALGITFLRDTSVVARDTVEIREFFFFFLRHAPGTLDILRTRGSSSITSRIINPPWILIRDAKGRE